MNFSIIIPVYNEAGNIGPLVDEISAAVGSEFFELIYVDDCSNDAPASKFSNSTAAPLVAPDPPPRRCGRAPRCAPG